MQVPHSLGENSSCIKVKIFSAAILFGFVGGQLAIFVGRQSDNKLAIAPQFVARVSQ